jgi:peptidoglycan/LPS O-acetylase OafA/YrhL
VTNRALSERPRLAWLDALRGLAALLVFLDHSVVALRPEFGPLIYGTLNIGHAGVICFFFVSGYIIPASLGAGQRVFWIRRVCRLMPLYWAVLALTLALVFVNLLPVPEGWQEAPPLLTIAANALMLQRPLGSPDLVPVTWTLLYEWLFYALISVLAAAGLLRRIDLIALTALTLALVVHLVLPLVGLSSGYATLFDWRELIFYLALMLAGTAAASWHAGRLSDRSTVLLAVLLIALVAGHQTREAGMVAGRVLGLALAYVGLLFHRASWPAPLVTAGRLSYAIYLLHLPIIHALPALGPASPVVWLVLVLLLAVPAERWIERPGQALGRCLARRYTRLNGHASVVSA